MSWIQRFHFRVLHEPCCRANGVGFVPTQVQEEVREFQVFTPATAGVEPSRKMADCFSRTFVLARIKGCSLALTSNCPKNLRERWIDGVAARYGTDLDQPPPQDPFNFWCLTFIPVMVISCSIAFVVIGVSLPQILILAGGVGWGADGLIDTLVGCLLYNYLTLVVYGGKQIILGPNTPHMRRICCQGS